MTIKNIMIKLRNNMRSKYKNYDDNEECILRFSEGYLFCNDADNMLTFTHNDDSDDLPVFHFDDDKREYGLYVRETDSPELNKYIEIIEKQLQQNGYKEISLK